MSRMKNSQINVAYGFAGHFAKIFARFAVRTLMIYILGAVYLGLDGLFLNIIAVLSLAELGIGNAVCFALYKPIAYNDTNKINAYMRLYKNVYQIIGAAILVLGLILLPFLRYLVKFDSQIDVNYNLVYLLFLSNSVASYFFGSYRQIFLMANQQSFLTDKFTAIANVTASAMQIAVLLFFKNYYIFLAVSLVTTVIKNLCLSNEVAKRFPYLVEPCATSLEPDERRDLFKNTYALAVNKISTVVYTSSDNIVISVFIGTIVVGYYSNYSLIISTVTGFISIIFSSIVAGLGNINAQDNTEHLYSIFKKVLFANTAIYGFCFTCFWVLLNPFILLWLGEEYVLNNRTVFIIALLFLMPGLNHTCTIFRAACGLFWQTRYRAIATAAVNVVVSILLAKKMGLDGVLLGTIIAYYVTIFTVDPRVVFRDAFKKSAKPFYVWYVKSFVIILVSAAVVFFICGRIPSGGVFWFVARAALCALISSSTYIIIYRKTEEFSYFMNILLSYKRRFFK